MAEYFGSNADLRDNSVPSEKINSREDHGRLRVAYDEYTIPAADTLSANDIIKMMKLPKGCKVYDVHLHCPQIGSAGGNGELNVGYQANGEDVADPNAFLDQVEVGSAAANVRMSDTLTLAGNGFVPGAETQVIITANETIDDGLDKVIKLWVFYGLD